MELCTTRSHGEILIAQMPNSIDHVAALTLEKDLLELLARKPKGLLCDLSGTKYISSSGLRIFLKAAKAAKVSGIRFGLFGMTTFVDHIFSVSGFTPLFSIHTTEDAAVSALSRP